MNQVIDEVEWENLISFIKEKQVIPILGRNLSTIEDPETGFRGTYNSWLALKLSEMVLNERPENPNLNQVVCKALSKGYNSLRLSAVIKRISLSAKFQPTESYQKLAAIHDFPVLVTTSIDGLLASALASETGKSPQALSYGPKRWDDLPDGWEAHSERFVYHLFGSIFSNSGSVLSDDDLIEWLTGFQSETHAPENLGLALENNHLLFIGTGFDGWLARFFMRAAKRQPLRHAREVQEYVADPAVMGDRELVAFLGSVSKSTILAEKITSSEAFIGELYERWQDRSSDEAGNASPGNVGPPTLSEPRFVPPSRDMDSSAIFLSYSRTDLESARMIKRQFDTLSLPLWFDMDSLDAGEDYTNRIRSNIESCCCFVPVLSKSALERSEAFFYREWQWAIERAENFAPGEVFILPLVVDDLDVTHPRIPPEFRALDITKVENGRVPEKLLRRAEQAFHGASYHEMRP